MQCPQIPVLSWGEFNRNLYYKAIERHIPITGSIEVTTRCNLRCAHCYINLPAGDRQALRQELTFREICGIIDQVADEGCLWLLLTGGEPFLRRDFPDICVYAIRKGLLITLFTNGTTVTPGIADHLAEWPPSCIEVTIYGHSRETYEAVTGIPGSHAQCLRGIQLLTERNLPLELKTMAITMNRHEIGDMGKFAKGLGLKFRFDPVVNMRIDGDRNPGEFRIPPEEVVALDLADEKRMKEWRKFAALSAELSPHPEVLYQCGAGISTFHIDPYGQLSACILSRVPSCDLRHMEFTRGWESLRRNITRQKWSRETPCRRCELSLLCDQCPGWAQLENNDAESPVDYLCQIAHHRAEAFGFNEAKTGGKR